MSPNGKGLHSHQVSTRVGIRCTLPDTCYPRGCGCKPSVRAVGRSGNSEAKSLFELSKTIINEVRSIQGVQDTTTLLQGAL